MVGEWQLGIIDNGKWQTMGNKKNNRPGGKANNA